MGLLAIISSCSIKIVNKEKVLYSEKGLLFATNEESYIFIPSSYKNSTNIQYGYNITNKYDKYFRQRLAKMFTSTEARYTIEKKDYFQDLNLQSTNPLYYVSDSIKIFEVAIEFKKIKSNIKVVNRGETIIDTFSYKQAGVIKKIIYKNNKDVIIYSIWQTGKY